MSECPDHEHLTRADLDRQLHAAESRVDMVNDLVTQAFTRGLAQGLGAAGSVERLMVERQDYGPAVVPAATRCYVCNLGPDRPGADTIRIIVTMPARRYRGWVHTVCASPVQALSQGGT